jgi:hypothetical protein
MFAVNLILYAKIYQKTFMIVWQVDGNRQDFDPMISNKSLYLGLSTLKQHINYD